jgi:AcrR family transcriptional regulator
MATVRDFAPVTSRRIEICQTAAQIFHDRGYHATAVSDIARALGITKAGLYHYFESKEALLFEITTYGLDRVRDDVIVPARAIRDPGSRLRQLVVRHARLALRGRGASPSSPTKSGRCLLRCASRWKSGCARTSISCGIR